jgi:hypothetical protein
MAFCRVLEWFIAFVTSQASVGFMVDWDRIGQHEAGIFRGVPVIRHDYFVRADPYSWPECTGKAAIL